MISVCIIAKNEASNIQQCIRSVQQIASETIVLDTGSEDNTVSIAQAMGTRVFSFKYHGKFNYADARNECQSYARQPWILVLDCDETLLDDQHVLKSIQEAPEKTLGFFLFRRNRFFNKEAQYESDYRANLRLFRNHPKVKWINSIHEEIWSSIVLAHGAIGYCKALIDHRLDALSYKQIIEKQVNYRELINSAIKNDPNNYYMHLHLGKTEITLGNLNAALPALTHALRSSHSFIKCLAYNYISLTHGICGNFELAHDALNQSLKLCPDQSYAFYIQGELFYAQGNYAAAKSSFDQCALVDTKDNFHSPTLVADKYLTLAQLNEKQGYCLLRMGEIEAAYTHLSQASNASETASSAYYGLAQLHLARNQFQEAKLALEKVNEISPKWEVPKRLNKAVSSRLNNLI